MPLLWKSFGKRNDNFFGQINVWHDVFMLNDRNVQIQSSDFRVKSSLSIHYIIKGKGYFITQEGKQHLKSGDAFLIFPGKVCYYADSDDPWEYCGISVSGKGFIGEFLSCCDANPKVLHSSEKVGYIGEMICENVNSKKNETENEKYIKSCWYNIMSLLCGEHNGEIKSGNAYLRNARAYIREHYSDHSLYVSDVAKAIGVSHSYLCRLFSESEYKSAENYIVMTRLGEAKKMLENTDENINEISWNCGYPDPVNFGKMFRKRVGMTPTEYRKANRKENGYPFDTTVKK